MTIRLDCPLCGATVSDGSAPTPGACPACGARYEGGGDTPRDAAEAVLSAFGTPGDADRLVAALFDESAGAGDLAITSDQRDGFYAWWVFVADTAEAPARLERLAQH